MKTALNVAERGFALLLACALVLAAAIAQQLIWQHTGIQPIPTDIVLGVIAFFLTLRYRTVWMSAAWALVPIAFASTGVYFYLRQGSFGQRIAMQVEVNAAMQSVLVIAAGTAAAVLYNRARWRQDGPAPPAEAR